MGNKASNTIRFSRHVPRMPSTFSAAYNRTANKRPRRYAQIKHLRWFDLQLPKFRAARKAMLKAAREELGQGIIAVHHSIWPRAYGFEYQIYLQEPELEEEHG